VDSQTVEALLSDLCQNVGGDWLLAGGSLVLIEFGGGRPTEDIDIVNLTHPTLSPVASQTELFRAALRLGLSAENVNSPVGFFVNEIPGWQSHLVEMRTGPKGRIFRPDLALLVTLKLRRGTETDLEDLRVAFAKAGLKEFDEAAFRQMASREIQSRFSKLRKTLGL
jgi:hypothetical protein